MASNAKKKTTFAKLNRENALRERRARKQERKQARRETAAAAAPPPEVPASDGTLDPSPTHGDVSSPGAPSASSS